MPSRVTVPRSLYVSPSQRDALLAAAEAMEVSIEVRPMTQIDPYRRENTVGMRPNVIDQVPEEMRDLLYAAARDIGVSFLIVEQEEYLPEAREVITLAHPRGLNLEDDFF